MTELTSPSRDAKKVMLRALPGACARNCPFRILCDAASRSPETRSVGADLPAASVTAACETAERDIVHRVARKGGGMLSASHPLPCVDPVSSAG